MRLRHLLTLAGGQLHELVKRHTRSPEWRALEQAHLRAQPRCAACGGTSHLQVHHVRPYHVWPELELEPRNLLTLCLAEGCSAHLTLGHGGRWTAWNPKVRADVNEVFFHPERRAAVEERAKKNRQV